LNRTIDLSKTSPTDRAIIRGSTGSALSVRQARDSHAIAVITCVNDEPQYDICLRYVDALQIPSGYTLEKIGVLGAVSMAEGYQRAMEASKARYKIYLHQDTYIVHAGLLGELVQTFRTYPHLGIVGVVGTTRMPASGIWWGSKIHMHGRVWEYRRETGFPGSVFGRRLHLSRFRSFVGDYLPAVGLDGLFVATQYDIAWEDPLGGFLLYDQVQALNFIKAGLEVGIVRQGAIWCLHWGHLHERSREQRDHMEVAVARSAAAFVQHYPEFIGVSAKRLYERHRRSAGRSGTAAWDHVSPGAAPPPPPLRPHTPR
jgi:hypothetical protein